MRRLLSSRLFAAAILLLAGSVRATENDIQLWSVVTLNHGLGERWGVHLQARLRIDDDVSRTKDFMIRSFVSWRPLEPLTLDLGYDHLHSYHSRFENRIWQSAEYRLEWRELASKNRVRLDERFPAWALIAPSAPG